MCNIILTGVWFHGFVAIPMWNVLDSLELITLIEDSPRTERRLHLAGCGKHSEEPKYYNQ